MPRKNGKTRPLLEAKTWKVSVFRNKFREKQARRTFIGRKCTLEIEQRLWEVLTSLYFSF